MISLTRYQHGQPTYFFWHATPPLIARQKTVKTLPPSIAKSMSSRLQLRYKLPDSVSEFDRLIDWNQVPTVGNNL